MDSGYAEQQFLLDQMEYKINRIYAQAEKELDEKIKKYYKDFKRLDEKKLKEVDDGKLSMEHYKEWRKQKVMSGKIWEQKKEAIAKDLYNANDLAYSVIYEYMPDLYASGHNFGTYEIEKGAHIDTSYTLYDHDAVERLLAENPDLLPKPKLNIAKDLKWNKTAIQGVMLQGLLQGDSIPHLAKRLSTATGERNRKACIRNARTMATSAHNGGKFNAFKRAEAMGVELVQVWKATFDGRTRDTHRLLDGEKRKVGEVFSNGCRFPADPQGVPSEVYNCRCKLKGVPKGLEPRAEKYRVPGKDIEGLSYEEWKKGKNVPQMRPKDLPKHKPEKKAPKPPVKVVNNDMITHKKGEHSAIYDLFEKARNNRAINKGKIAHNPVKELKEKLSFDKIVERVGGGDDTQGSCSSLAYAYIANKMGYDVLDFRGGSSRKFFSYDVVTKIINQLEGVKTQVFKVRNEVTETAETLRKLNLPWEKEYRLSVGRHAAIIRNTKNGYEYLELQSAVKNGWHSFELKDKYHYDYDRETKQLKITVEQTPATMEEVLEDRFGCYRGSFLVRDMELTEVDSYNNDEFLDIMGYINTKENKQHKSVNGHER